MTVILNIEWNLIEERWELVNNAVPGFRQVLGTHEDKNKLTKGVFQC